MRLVEVDANHGESRLLVLLRREDGFLRLIEGSHQLGLPPDTAALVQISCKLVRDRLREDNLVLI